MCETNLYIVCLLFITPIIIPNMLFHYKTSIFVLHCSYVGYKGNEVHML